MKKRVWVILFPVLFVLIGLEIGLRLLGPYKRAGKTPDNILWQPDSELGFVPAANLKTIVYTAEHINEVRTNKLGFRVATSTPVLVGSASENIMFLGDSQTMGVQVSVKSTFVALIDSELARKGVRMRAINAGCNGFNTVQEYLFFKKLYDQGLRPKVVVVYVTNNDLFEDVPRLPYGRVTLDGYGYVALRGPDPALLEGLRRAKEIPRRQANFWLRRSALLRHLRYSYRIWRNPHDVAGWVENTYLRDELDPSAQNHWAIVTASVRSLNRLVSSYGGRLVIAVHPDPVEWSDAFYAKLKDLVPELSGQIDRMKLQRGYRRVAEDVGVIFIDMLRDFPAISVKDFRFAMDPHANRSGHRIIAQQLLRGFERVGLFKELKSG